jgi:predicted ester cyclase
MLAEPFIEHNPLDPRMGNGKAAAIASFQGILDATPDLRVEVHDLIATPDRVAIRATYSGTDSGTGWGAPMGVPATGKPFSVEGIDVAILDEAGMFREHYGLFDVMGMMGQLGLLPAPG